MTLQNIIAQTVPTARNRHNLALDLEKSLQTFETSECFPQLLGCFLEDHQQVTLREPKTSYRYLSRSSGRSVPEDVLFRMSLYFSLEDSETSPDEICFCSPRRHDAQIILVPFDWGPYEKCAANTIHLAYQARIDITWKEASIAELNLWAVPHAQTRFVKSLQSFVRALGNQLSSPEDDVLEQCTQPPQDPILNRSERSRLFRAAEVILEKMNIGECYLANLTTRLEVPRTLLARNVSHFLKRWAINPSRFAWMIRHGKTSIDCYSPERFFKIKDGVLITEPIKGTASFTGPADTTNPSAQEAATYLWQSIKERCEQHLVTDLLRNDMAPLCLPGSIEVTAPLAIRLTSGLCQMSSRIEGLLKPNTSLSDILSTMLPPGSVTGTPKSAVAPILSTLEGQERGLYCGICIDWHSPTQAEATLLIRGIFAQGDRCYVGTGAGLTTLSDPSAEVEEMETKLRSFLSRCFDQ